jgi:hypothetical protein
MAIVCISLMTACAGETVLLDNPGVQSEPATRTFEGHGVTFDYPGTWVSVNDPAPAPSGQPVPVQPDAQAVDVVGIDQLDFVAVSYGVTGLEADDFDSWSEERKLELAARLAQRPIELLAGPVETRTAGFRALRYETREPSAVGYVLHVTWVGFLRRTTQFAVECNSTPQHAAEIQRGCEQILATLQIG